MLNSFFTIPPLREWKHYIFYVMLFVMKKKSYLVSWLNYFAIFCFIFHWISTQEIFLLYKANKYIYSHAQAMHEQVPIKKTMANLWKKKNSHFCIIFTVLVWGKISASVFDPSSPNLYHVIVCSGNLPQPPRPTRAWQEKRASCLGRASWGGDT